MLSIAKKRHAMTTPVHVPQRHDEHGEDDDLYVSNSSISSPNEERSSNQDQADVDKASSKIQATETTTPSSDRHSAKAKVQHKRQKLQNQALRHDHPEHQDLPLQLLIMILLLLLYFIILLPIIPAWPTSLFYIAFIEEAVAMESRSYHPIYHNRVVATSKLISTSPTPCIVLLKPF